MRDWGEGSKNKETEGSQKREMKLTNPGQVVSWHKYPEITFFLGCRDLDTFPRKTSLFNLGWGVHQGRSLGRRT